MAGPAGRPAGALAGDGRAGAAARPDRRGGADRGRRGPPHRHRLPSAAAVGQGRSGDRRPHRQRAPHRLLHRARAAPAGRVDVHDRPLPDGAPDPPRPATGPRGNHVQPRPRPGNLGRPGQDPGRPAVQPTGGRAGHDQPEAGGRRASPARRPAAPAADPEQPEDRQPRTPAGLPGGVPGIGGRHLRHPDRPGRGHQRRTDRLAQPAVHGHRRVPAGQLRGPGGHPAPAGREHGQVRVGRRRAGETVPGQRRQDRPHQPVRRDGGHPAGHPPAGRGARAVRRPGRAHRPGRHRAAAQPPAHPRLGRVPGLPRPRHDPGQRW